MTSSFHAEATVVGIRRGRPPIQTVSIDLMVEPPPTTGWLMLADIVGETTPDGPTGIHTADLFVVAPGRSVVWLKGHAGVLAVPLDGDGPVVFEGLQLQRWEELEEDTSIALAVAESLALGEIPLEDAFDDPITPWTAGRVDMEERVAAERIVQRLEAPFDAPFDVQVGSSHWERVRLRR